MGVDQLRSRVSKDDALSISRQCEILGLARSSWYYEPAGESPLNLELMRWIDKEYTRYPFLGSPAMTTRLKKNGYDVNHKRVERLMRLMGLAAVTPRKQSSQPGKGVVIWPYLLRDLTIDRPNQAWCTDITYIPVNGGFFYLTAVMDWFSRYVLSWELSNSLDASFCVSALRCALEKGRPQIFNTDQGSQFTSDAFTSVLLEHEILISMDGRGRCFDNIFIERLWRSVKYEEVYLKEYRDGWEANENLRKYFDFYNTDRYHSSLGDRLPQEVHYDAKYA